MSQTEKKHANFDHISRNMTKNIDKQLPFIQILTEYEVHGQHENKYLFLFFIFILSGNNRYELASHYETFHFIHFAYFRLGRLGQKSKDSYFFIKNSSLSGF